MQGEGRWARYRVPLAGEAAGAGAGRAEVRAEGEAVLPLSAAGRQIQTYVRRPPEARKPAGYDRAFLDSYRPNETFYLVAAERAHLREVGTPKIAAQPAGTYAKQILNRLLIDLSWNSSRLEGNTYSLLDTRRLINLGEEAEGKQRLEAQMILNHKVAIEYLVNDAEHVAVNEETIIALHALLSDGLLADPIACGKLRNRAVEIGGTIERSRRLGPRSPLHRRRRSRGP